MGDRERLIKLIQEAEDDYMVYEMGAQALAIGIFKSREEYIADHLIANGVILPPCKVGDIIYQIDGVRIYPSTIHEITYTSSKVIFVTENIVFDEQAINNSIFLTREETEKALERSKGNA